MSRRTPVNESLRKARASSPEGRAWLDRLPELVNRACEEWDLQISGAPFDGGLCGWVAPVVSPSATAVLKITWPHSEASGEAAALRWWKGAGSARLLAENPATWTILLEQCRPGITLRDAGLPNALGLAAGATVLRSLWARGLPGSDQTDHFDSMIAICDDWADLAATRLDAHGSDLGALGTDPGILRMGIDLLRSLPRSAERRVVVHGDANPGNLLAAERMPFLAIDPKPLIGDPAYDPWPLVAQLDSPFDGPGDTDISERIRRLADHLDLEPARIAAWGVARDVEGGLWAAANGDVSGGASWIRSATTVASMIG